MALRSPVPALMIQPQPQADERERQDVAGQEEGEIFGHGDGSLSGLFFLLLQEFRLTFKLRRQVY